MEEFSEPSTRKPPGQTSVINNYYFGGDPQKDSNKAPAGAAESKPGDSSTWVSQRQFWFPHIRVNDDVNDLHIEFNVAVTVVTDSNGLAGAGPSGFSGFGTIKGNGTSSITLADPFLPAGPGASIPSNDVPVLRFRTTDKGEIEIKEWWWTKNGVKSNQDVGKVDKDTGQPTAK
jgi:hypothetical protein